MIGTLTMLTPNGETVSIKKNEYFHVEVNGPFDGIPSQNISGSITFKFPVQKSAQRILHDRQRETGRPARVYIPEPLPWE